jgi:haloalkane dehalogenase
MLICWGARDFVFDMDYLSEWRGKFPRAEVQTFPEAGHYALEDVPDQVLTRIQHFLARNPV